MGRLTLRSTRIMASQTKIGSCEMRTTMEDTRRRFSLGLASLSFIVRRILVMPMSENPIKRYPASYLCDIMYGVEPMTREIATVVRYLRVERKLSYSEVGYALCEQGAGSS